MKNKLQYAYSISVFVGVLLTAYLMMNQEGNARIPGRSFQSTTFRAEAQVLDPAVSQLLEMEEALSRMRKNRRDDYKNSGEVDRPR